MDTILVVEDEKSIREMLRQGLRLRGYEVLLAENGDEALRVCANHHEAIQLLLCDVVTPGLKARELIRIAVGMYPRMKVVLMTGYDEYPFASGDAEVFQLIRKPFTVSELASRLKVILGEECVR
jgi:two-component system cell cycle sensor histidine kinase/response regulator CckA